MRPRTATCGKRYFVRVTRLPRLRRSQLSLFSEWLKTGSGIERSGCSRSPGVALAGALNTVVGEDHSDTWRSAPFGCGGLISSLPTDFGLGRATPVPGPSSPAAGGQSDRIELTPEDPQTFRDPLERDSAVSEDDPMGARHAVDRVPGQLLDHDPALGCPAHDLR